MSNIPEDLDFVVSELRSGLEDGSILLDRKDDQRPPGNLASMRAEAEEFIRSNTASIGASVIGSSLLPGVATATVSFAQISLVYNLARIYGFAPSMEEARQIASSLAWQGKGIAAAEALSFVPIIGWAVKSGIFLGALRSFGSAAINYFEGKARETHQ